MKREDIRALMADYAAGSLSESQRKLLAKAAVEDAEIYNELSREHVLRIEKREPVAGRGLLSTREKPQRLSGQWWERSWIWGMVAAVSAALLIVLVPPEPTHKEAVREIERYTPVGPPPIAPGNSAPPAASIFSTQGDPTAPSAPASNVQTGVAQEPSQPGKGRGPADSGQSQASPGVSTPVASANAPAGAPPANRPSIPAAGRANEQRISAAAAGAAKAARVMIRYAVEPGGHLKITPTADGFLYVQVRRGAGRGQFSPLVVERVKSNVPVSLDLPDQADVVSVSFSEDGRPPVIASSFRDDPSGTVADSNSRSTAHLEFGIRLKPVQK